MTKKLRAMRARVVKTRCARCAWNNYWDDEGL